MEWRAFIIERLRYSATAAAVQAAQLNCQGSLTIHLVSRAALKRQQLYTRTGATDRVYGTDSVLVVFLNTGVTYLYFLCYPRGCHPTRGSMIKPFEHTI